MLVLNKAQTNPAKISADAEMFAVNEEFIHSPITRDGHCIDVPGLPITLLNQCIPFHCCWL